MVAKMSGHWPNGLPPRVLAGYIEDLARGISSSELRVSVTEVHLGGNQVSNSNLSITFGFAPEWFGEHDTM